VERIVLELKKRKAYRVKNIPAILYESII